MIVKVVQSHERPTHRFFRDGRYVYLVANGCIDVSEACNISVSDVEVKNGYTWSKVAQVNPCEHEGMK